MGIAASFDVLAELPPDQRAALAETALRDGHPPLQEAAFRLLADPAGLNRPDLLVLRFAALAPELRRRMAERKEPYLAAARALARSEREPERRAGLVALAALDPFDAAKDLVRALEDPAPVVREAAASLLDELGQRHYVHLVTARLHGDPESRDYLQRHRAAMLALLPALLRLFPKHGKPVFFDIAIESDPESYPIVVDHVLVRGAPETKDAFLRALAASATEEAVRLLFRLSVERSARMREAAADVLRRRADPAFHALVAVMLSRLPPLEFEALAAKAVDLPWWPGPEALAGIDPASAARLLEFAARSAVPPPRRDEFIVQFLRSRHPDVRTRALAILQVLEHPGFAAVAEEALDDPDDEVKAAAARAIIGLDPPHKAKLLLPLLDAGSEELRRLAMREVASAGVDRYLKAFDRLDARTRETAVRALAKIDPRVVDRLLEETAPGEAGRRMAALRSIGLLGAEPEARERLLRLLEDPDRYVRATALRVVKVAATSDGFRRLVRALDDPDPRVRANAVEALEETSDPRAVDLLLPLLEDAVPRVRANAAKALCRRWRDEGRLGLEAMLRHADEGMRRSAAWAVGQVRFDGAAALLRERAEAETSPAVRAKIAEVLRELG